MTSRARLLAASLALLAGTSDGALTQGTLTRVTVQGLAVDSLHNTPLRGALISLAGTRHTALSDERGRFRLDSVAPGRYSATMQHDAIDSLGVASFTTSVLVTDGRDPITVAIPSFATLWRGVCGRSAAPKDSGFVFGTVRDAMLGKPLAHAAIRASWTDLAYNRVSGVSQTPMGGVVLSDSNGSYAICGVPNGALLRLSGATDSATSGTIEVLPRTAGVTHIDFAVATIADSAVRGTVSGVVRDEAGKPVPQARIELNGAPDARTDDEGRFTMSGVPLGTRQLQVVSIGWDPTAAIVHVSPREAATLALVLRKVTALKEVRVSVRTVKQRWVEDLEDRRKLGIARFVDSTIVERRPNVTEAIMDSPSARLQRGGQISFPGSCNPTVRIDRREIPSSEVPAELRLLSPASIATIEVYAHETAIPVEFWPRRGKPCAAIVIWTKLMLP